MKFSFLFLIFSFSAAADSEYVKSIEAKYPEAIEVQRVPQVKQDYIKTTGPKLIEKKVVNEQKLLKAIATK